MNAVGIALAYALFYSVVIAATTYLATHGHPVVAVFVLLCGMGARLKSHPPKE